MTRRKGLLSLLVVAMVALAAMLFYRHLEENVFPAGPVTFAKKPSLVASKAFAATLAHLRDAERIADPFERCVNYPDPPWIHWDHQLIAAFCRSRSFQYMRLDEIKAALDGGHAELVDSAFGSYLADNFAKPEKHGILTRVYRELFDSSSRQTGEVVRRWVALSPKSAFALAARGAYYEKAAGDARGGEYARDTPEESFRRMRKLADRAEADLRQAVRLEPKLTPAYDSMIFVGRLTSNQALVQEALKAALAIDPTDERFYLDWMATVEPRWGGSLADMARVAREAELHADANPLLKLVTEKQLAYLGVVEMQNDNYPAALAAFEQAFAVAPSPVDLETAGESAGKIGDHDKAIWYYSEASRFDRFQSASNLAKRAWELNQIGKVDFAADDLKTVASLTSGNPETLYHQAWAFAAAGDYAQAEESYLNILKFNPRHEWALADLAKLYAGPLNQPANAKPLISRLQKLYPTIAGTWIATASLVCSEEGKTECRAALRRYLDLADENDPDEKQRIDFARMQLKELDQKSAPAKG